MVITKALIALSAILGLIYFVSKLLQRYGKLSSKLCNLQKNMKIDGVLYIDNNTKVVTIRHSKMSYVLAIAKNNIVIIDKYIEHD